MKYDYSAFKKRLINILERKEEHSDVTELVKLSMILVQVHLSKMRYSLFFLLERNGVSIFDLANDCIGDAFKRNAGTFKHLENFRNSLRSDVYSINEVELFIAYRSFITKVADVQLARQYAELDPNGYKIFRNIKETVK